MKEKAVVLLINKDIHRETQSEYTFKISTSLFGTNCSWGVWFVTGISGTSTGFGTVGKWAYLRFADKMNSP